MPAQNAADPSTVAVELKPVKKPSLQDARDFLRRVMDWDGSSYVNIHNFMQQEPGYNRRFMRGTAVQSVDEAINHLIYLAGQSRAQDVYFCTSTQKACEEKVIGRKKLKVAVRNRDNAVRLKALFLDIDVGKEGGYATREDVFPALRKFILDTGLPFPTASVASGTGGCHLYWILERALSVAEWQRLADAMAAATRVSGLICDTQCTVDAVRLLRVPQTRNFKTDPPSPVVLKALRPDDIPNERLEQALAPFVAEIGLPPRMRDEVWEGDEFAAGTQIGAAPRDIDEVAVHCAWIRDTLANAGADNDNPKWFLSLRLALFCTEPNETGHRLSRGHHGYLAEETQQEIDRLRQERERGKDVGFISCRAISEVGAPQCATCPHLGEGKSPLNFAGQLPPQVTGTKKQAVETINKKHFAILFGNKLRIGSHVPAQSGTGTELRLLSKIDFLDFYSNRRTKIIGTGAEPELLEGFKWWWSDPNRRSYEGVAFDAQGGRDLAGQRLNLWTGFGVEPRPGEWLLLRRHILEEIAGGNPEWGEYILNWMASVFQNIGQPCRVALVVRGIKGCGKGTLFNMMVKAFGKHAIVIRNPKHLTGDFNGHMLNAVFVFVDEGFWAGNVAAEGVLKGLITDPTVMVEKKGVDAIQIDNFLNFGFAANANYVVPATEDERRYAVFDCSKDRAPAVCGADAHTSYFAPIYEQMENGGLAAMLHELLHRDVGGFNIMKVPQTPALQDQKLLGLKLYEFWWFNLLNAGEAPLSMEQRRTVGRGNEDPDFALTEAIEESLKSAEGPGRKKEERRYQDYLRERGCISAKNKTRDKRGWRLPKLSDARAEWEGRFGPQGWDNPAGGWEA